MKYKFNTPITRDQKVGPGPGPGPTWVLGPLGPWPTGEGGGGVQKWSKSEVLRMKSPIVENVRTSSDILLDTSRGLQLPNQKKNSKIVDFFHRFSKSLIFPYFSVWGLLLVSFYKVCVVQ